MWFGHASQKEGIEQLHTAVGQLEKLAASTEGEFLSLGEGLQSFHSRSRDIAEWSSAVTASLTGTEITRAMDGLGQIFSHVKALDDGSRQDTENMRMILDGIEGMQHSLGGFGRIVRNLLVLCSFIRIESARMTLNDTGFNTLSADVGNLAVRIESKSTQLLDQSMLLSALLRKNMGDVASFEAGKHGQALSILDGAARCLDAMTAKHSLSATALKETAGRWERIAGSIGEVVSSLQFHDITRQRIEHAKDALAEVARNRSDRRRNGERRFLRALFPLPGKDGGAMVTAGSGNAAVAIRTCEIHRAQLANTRQEIVAAVERIIRNLGGIASHVDEMGGETRNLLNSADPSGDSFLASLDKGFTSLSGAMAEYHRINQELSATIDHAAGTIGSMSAFIREIEAIGTEIQMIALNASIRAAHAGEYGEALGVLADAIRQLSADTSGQTKIISEGLRTVIDSAGGWTKRVREKAENKDGSHDRMGENVGRMMKSLRQIDEETRGMLSRINDHGRALSDDIAGVLQGIRVHERFDREISDVNAVLERFAAGLKKRLTNRDRIEETAALEKLEDQYTMHSERAIHRAVVRAAAVSPSVGYVEMAAAAGAEAAETGDNTEDLGDNVELF